MLRYAQWAVFLMCVAFVDVVRGYERQFIGVGHIARVEVNERVKLY